MQNFPESYISFHFSYKIKKPASFLLAGFFGSINRELPENRLDNVHIQCRR